MFDHKLLRMLPMECAKATVLFWVWLRTNSQLLQHPHKRITSGQACPCKLVLECHDDSLSISNLRSPIGTVDCSLDCKTNMPLAPCNLPKYIWQRQRCALGLPESLWCECENRSRNQNSRDYCKKTQQDASCEVSSQFPTIRNCQSWKKWRMLKRGTCTLGEYGAEHNLHFVAHCAVAQLLGRAISTRFQQFNTTLTQNH